jgi:metacaspase-1
MLTDRLGYLPCNIFVLAEGVPGVGEIHQAPPTKQYILAGINWLVKDMRYGETAFFFYAGHGDEVPDVNGDEAGGWDQAIIPMDFDRCGPILDDWIYDLLVCKVPRGARVTAVVDACHSGSVLDLPVNYLYGEALNEYDEESGERSAGQAAGSGFGDNQALARARMTSWAPVPKQRRCKVADEIGEVVLFSSAADLQKSTDARVDASDARNSAWMGVFTSCWLQQAKKLYPVLAPGSSSPCQDISFGQFLDAVKDSLSARLDAVYRAHGGRQHRQSPQLSTSHAMYVYDTIMSM